MQKVFFFLGIFLLLMLCSCQPSKTTPKPNTVTLTFNATNSIDWILQNVEGAANVGTIGAEDPPLTLTIGTRYTIVNKTGLAHPFQLLDGSTTLLSESGGGSFESNALIEFEKNVNGFSFTLTQDLADVLDAYNCAYHLAMRGTITSKTAP